MGDTSAHRREAWTAARVAALRARLGLTQVGMAGEMGVRQQTVSEWETGRYAPRGASAKLLTLLEERAAYGSTGERPGGEGAASRGEGANGGGGTDGGGEGANGGEAP
jgi:DNA-binding XRE family transcriptional regulator